ncbi:MAG: hypothetical protein RJB13_2555 [Pseudomonadota bacterium]
MGLSQREMAALVLEAVGSEFAARLFLELGKKDQLVLLKTLSAERKKLSDDEIEDVYSDFISLVRSRLSTVGTKQAPHTSFAGIDLPRASRVNEICQNIPEWILADYLKGQLDSVISAVLGLVEPSRAGMLLKSLPEQRQAKVVLSLSAERVLEAVVLDELEADLEELALRSAHGSYGHRIGGGQRIMALVQALEPQMREKLISELEEHDPRLAHHIEKTMLSVERLAGLLPQHLAQVLAHMKDGDIGLFLRGETKQVQNLYLACLSSRRRGDIECLLDSGGAVTQKQKSEASDKLRACAQHLREEGKVLFPWEESLVS